MHKRRYSPIADVRLLRQMAVQGVHTGYQLLLAHEVLKEPEQYGCFVRDMRKYGGDEPFIIMDNGVVELGQPLALEEVIEAADVVQASCVVTPDVLGSFTRTQAVIEKNLDTLRDCGYPLMMIPQGASNDELIQCVDWLRSMFPHAGDHGDLELWGIPRWVTNKIGSRIPLVHYITRSGGTVHLLGMSNNIEDDFKCTKIGGVIGIDSANPIVMGINEVKLSTEPYKHYERPDDFFEPHELTDIIRQNLMYMHENVG